MLRFEVLYAVKAWGGVGGVILQALNPKLITWSEPGVQVSPKIWQRISSPFSATHLEWPSSPSSTHFGEDALVGSFSVASPCGKRKIEERGSGGRLGPRASDNNSSPRFVGLKACLRHQPLVDWPPYYYWP